MARAAILTRPAGQNGRLASALSQHRIATLEWPVLQIEALDRSTDFDGRWAELPTYDLVHFASANAIAHLHAHEAVLGAIRWKPGAVLAVMGPGSRQALPEAWQRADLRIVTPGQEETSAPSALDSEALLRTLDTVMPGSWAGLRALQVKGDGGRTWLRDALRERGVEVAELSVYRRACPIMHSALAGARAAQLALHADAAWIMSSAEGARCLDRMLQPYAELAALARQHPVVVTHDRVGAAMTALGFRHIRQCAPDDEAIARTIESIH